jgi:Xaa-Pro aminopeptidase
MELDWHGDRSDLPELALIDQLEADAPIDFVAVRAYRLGRVREQMATRSLDALILLDPVNIRYATGARNMQVFHARNPARYLFVPQSGLLVAQQRAACAAALGPRALLLPPRPSSRHREVAGRRRLPEGQRLRTDSRWQRQEHPAPPEDQAAATA